jgi:hypothetical protein
MVQAARAELPNNQRESSANDEIADHDVRPRSSILGC